MKPWNKIKWQAANAGLVNIDRKFLEWWESQEGNMAHTPGPWTINRKDPGYGTVTHCSYCLDDLDPIDLDAHLATHQVADVGALTLAVEALADYQQVILELTRALRREREKSERLTRWLGDAIVRMICAENEAERWQVVACRLWRRYRR